MVSLHVDLVRRGVHVGPQASRFLDTPDPAPVQSQNRGSRHNDPRCSPPRPCRAGGRRAGNVEPDDGIVAIGSGGPFALAAAKALAHNTELDARAIAEKAMIIAGEICIYTNAQIVVEEL